MATGSSMTGPHEIFFRGYCIFSLPFGATDIGTVQYSIFIGNDALEGRGAGMTWVKEQCKMTGGRDKR